MNPDEHYIPPNENVFRTGKLNMLNDVCRVIDIRCPRAILLGSSNELTLTNVVIVATLIPLV
jgi:hypothetical protein